LSASFSRTAPELASVGSILIVSLIGSAYVFVLSFVPAVIGVAVTESLRLRRARIYGLIGVVTALTCYVLFGFAKQAADPILNATVMAVAGLAAGIVYWWIAGRSAGGWRGVAERPVPAK
jgi:hypothetical protein